MMYPRSKDTRTSFSVMAIISTEISNLLPSGSKQHEVVLFQSIPEGIHQAHH